MKRVLITVLLSLGMVVGSSGMALAAFDPFDQACSGETDSTVCIDADQAQSASDNSIWGPNGIVTKATRLISFAVGLAAVIVLLLAGLRYVTAGGDANGVASAKNTAKYAIIGVLIALFGQGLIIFVFDKL